MTDVTSHRTIRDAFGQFATGVTVVTALDSLGKPIGLTVNSFASVSLEPALVSWCVDKSSQRFDEFSKANYFCVSILNQNQKQVSDLFASRSWDDTVFEDAEWFEGLNGVPQISDSAAFFQCQTEHVYPGGDHLIIVGRVLEYAADAQPPLVFHAGDYRRIN